MTEQWQISTVGDEFDVQLGKMLDSAKNVGQPKKYLGNRSVQWGRVDIATAGTMLLTDADKRRYRVHVGDLLVCEGGEIGRAAIWRGEAPEMYFQKALHRLRPRRGYDVRLMQSFFEYWADNGGFADYSTQTSIAHLPREKLVSMPLPLPPPAVQSQIAEALMETDNLIATTERLIAKKEAIKQGMMQQLLTGRTRLPGFTGKWASGHLGDVLTVRHGRSQKDVEVSSGTVPILATGGQIGWADRPLYSKPSVLIGRKGTIDRPQFESRPFWTVDTLFYTEVAIGADPKFLYYVFQSIDWRSMNEASGVPSLSSSRIEGVEVLVPKLEEQVAIAEVLTDADAEIDALRVRRAKTRAVKQGMMQQLLTDRTRLPAKDEIAA